MAILAYGVEAPDVGGDFATWGEVLNNITLPNLFAMTAGVKTIALTGNKALVSTNSIPNEARNAVLRFTDGGLSANPTVTIPPEQRSYFVQNLGATYSIVFTCGGATGLLAPGRSGIVVCTGTDVFVWDPASDAAAPAAISAAAALASANAAAASATSAASSAGTATTAKDTAITAKNDAQTARDAAQGSATAASGSATAASGSDASANTKAGEASTSATASAGSATAASGSASAASTSATNSSNSATASAISAIASSNSAGDAATAQTAAETARDASIAAKNAAQGTAATAATDAAALATAAVDATLSGKVTAATNSATAAAGSAMNAAGSAGAASTSASNASDSATASSSSATYALAQATASGASASTAASSATAANTARAGAETARDQAVAIVVGNGAIFNTDGGAQDGDIAVFVGTTGHAARSSGISINDIITSDYVVTPRNVAPATGSTGQGPYGNPIVLTLTAYLNLAGTAIASRQFRIATDAAMTNVVVDSGAIAGAGDSYSLADLSTLSPSTTYYWQGRYIDTGGKVSNWSNATGFVTATKMTLDIGDPYAGGFYGALVEYGGQRYRLIVAPKSSGEATTLTWKTSTTLTAGTFSQIDGVANTALMTGAEHQAADFCRGLTIGGFTDWYLPAKLELQALYENLKPTADTNTINTGANPYTVPPRAANYTTTDPAITTIPRFVRSSGSDFFGPLFIWTSTQAADGTGGGMLYSRSGSAGQYVDTSKTVGTTVSFGVRAIRRIPISA